jgi:hypothetical protein
MSKIHYFQRYSSVENTVTNNTLQLIGRIYDYSAASVSKVLSELTGEAIDIGIEINQQERAGNSIPDGSIIQRSFKILIEAKVDSPPDVNQLVSHANAFGGESQKLLLLLTKHSIGKLEKEISEKIRLKYPDVIFKSITYEAICNSIKGLFKEHESSMAALVEDYIEYCNDAALFDQAKFLLRIVPCGKSIDLNNKYGIYFHPFDRGYTQHAYIGIYALKSVKAILEIESVFEVAFANGHLKKSVVQGLETDKFDTALIEIIKEAKEQCGYEIAMGHRFFCGKTADTDFRKLSPNGIQGARFLNLRDLLGEINGLDDVAGRLKTLDWK